TGDPVAATSAAGLVVGHVEQVEADRADRAAFARQAAVDPYQATPGADLLTALHGKDVLLVFVESYGRVALDGPATVTTPVSAALTRAQSALSRGGWSSRSALLTSSTYGGLSWLAHSTLQSGLWVDDQQRYDDLVAGDRLTLSSAFRRAGWRTASVVPSDHGPWWVGSRFYRFDAMSDADDLGYTGPSFGYADVPDEFTLARLAQRELAPGHRPVMAEVDLVSSHGPWTPLPSLVPWAEATDSSVYAGMPAGQPSAAQIWPTPARVQASYGRSIAYSLDSLVAFVENAHDDNLVLVVLGDHQPASIVSGPHSDRDVPISIISHDPSVLDRIDGWGWQDGLRPTPEAPRWRMDQFRDRFLAAYR
ncbi:sulfatase-like hydrolase/transferase, partial [Nostocoides japonicum]|uniref:sulfatase-like hydrolase/transferase n=1 Tax=Nostocoides japonicum TaxID=99481 RepID=UPI00065B814D